MAVMQVGVMRMPMHQGWVSMPMGVRLAWGIVRTVRMMVVFVVTVPVLVLHRFVNMLMLVSLRQMQPQTKRHQSTREQQFNG
jgi:hypothetical protein